MVDVSDKSVTNREAVAQAQVVMSPDTLKLIFEGKLPKGDVLAVARIAGIQAAKRTSELIPLCHPLPISKVSVEFTSPSEDMIEIRSTVRVTGRTGVEMEALVAASMAALTIYDMCKGVQKDIEITHTRLLTKSGGKSGAWQRP